MSDSAWAENHRFGSDREPREGGVNGTVVALVRPAPWSLVAIQALARGVPHSQALLLGVEQPMAVAGGRGRCTTL
eukprot:CAMPEP_0170200584 /NCGR_PEP_ID=MMETSP0040_2-20121228/69941_1 /TAXON_ID=641309 /ORGANISM="Lotharella oceanica, Strain CCMP622" /LENGTH=74 /DNA_ID=CAMNT_0010450767 /DNA_START=2047 /DNA_END=2268 /DNA_ORIENTATION=-